MQKFQGNRHNVARKVVRLRTKEMLSWATIAEQIGCSPRTARKLFQERQGAGQHSDHLVGKGGRWPSDWETAAEAPYIVAPGHVNQWDKVERPEAD